MQNNQKSTSQESVNIFSDFTNDTKLQADITVMEEKNKKTLLYYIQMATGIFKTTNALIFVCIWLFSLYAKAQSSEMIDLSLLKPVCFIFEWSNFTDYANCTSITSRSLQVKSQIELIKAEQFEKISPLIADIYSVENFIFSKEITFLINKSKNRVKPLQILREFDLLKNKFEPLEKSKISCSQISLHEENILKLSCEAFSSDWDKQIVGFSWDKSQNSVEGTSLSIATSFLNFLDENAKNFTLLNKQKVFSTSSVNNGPYTKKTSFDVELKFLNDSL